MRNSWRQVRFISHWWSPIAKLWLSIQEPSLTKKCRPTWSWAQKIICIRYKIQSLKNSRSKSCDSSSWYSCVWIGHIWVRFQSRLCKTCTLPKWIEIMLSSYISKMRTPRPPSTCLIIWRSRPKNTDHKAPSWLSHSVRWPRCWSSLACTTQLSSYWRRQTTSCYKSTKAAQEKYCRLELHSSSRRSSLCSTSTSKQFSSTLLNNHQYKSPFWKNFWKKSASYWIEGVEPQRRCFSRSSTSSKSWISWSPGGSSTGHLPSNF